MREINYLAVVVVAVAAFVLSTAWYIAFAKQRAELCPAAMADMKKPQPLKMLIEIVRNILLAYVLAYFVARLGIADWPAAIQFSLLV